MFKISQHIRDDKLIRSLVDFLGCGNVSVHKDAVYFEVTSFIDLYQKILPFFQTHLLPPAKAGVKPQDYLYFVSVLELMKDKLHLTESGLEQIRNIALGMHK